MPKDIAISLKNVSKDFRLPHERADSLKSLFVNPFNKNRNKFEIQHALSAPAAGGHPWSLSAKGWIEAFQKACRLCTVLQPSPALARHHSSIHLRGRCCFEVPPGTGQAAAEPAPNNSGLGHEFCIVRTLKRSSPSRFRSTSTMELLVPAEQTATLRPAARASSNSRSTPGLVSTSPLPVRGERRQTLKIRTQLRHEANGSIASACRDIGSASLDSCN